MQLVQAPERLSRAFEGAQGSAKVALVLKTARASGAKRFPLRTNRCSAGFSCGVAEGGAAPAKPSISGRGSFFLFQCHWDDGGGALCVARPTPPTEPRKSQMAPGSAHRQIPILACGAR